jgi:hypothetical protein
MSDFLLSLEMSVLEEEFSRIRDGVKLDFLPLEILIRKSISLHVNRSESKRDRISLQLK